MRARSLVGSRPTRKEKSENVSDLFQDEAALSRAPKGDQQYSIQGSTRETGITNLLRTLSANSRQGKRGFRLRSSRLRIKGLFVTQDIGVFYPSGARQPTEEMVTFIDLHLENFGVEAVCTELPFAPSAYYEYKAREADPERLVEVGVESSVDSVGDVMTMPWPRQ